VQRKAFSKSCFVMILVAVSIGLVTLGMRLPSLTGLSAAPGKPKPRPRAVIQQQVKTFKQAVCPVTPLVATMPATDYQLPEPTASSLPVFIPTETACLVSTQQLSRAPPA
jgi:hypothetical protein